MCVCLPPDSSNITVEYKLHTHRAAPGPPSDSPTDLAARVKALVDDMVLAHNAHFDLEEQHLAPVARKYFGIQRSKVCGIAMWSSSLSLRV